MSQIIRVVENGVEFFTVDSTGESGMSQRGLAILSGINESSLRGLLTNLRESKAPKRLKALENIDLYLRESYVKKGGKTKIIRSFACAKIIKHYAFSDNETAEYSLDKFNELGIETWIQQITGWQPPHQKQLKEWENTRVDGKITHSELTGAIAVYIERHPELSANAQKWIYTNTAQAVNLTIFNRKAKALAEDLGVDPKALRDALERKELLYIQQVEDTAARMILLFDTNPVEAIKEAFWRLLIPKQDRSLQQG